MTLRHLRIFSEVYRTKSMTQAADNLNMAQPAVSNAVRELESYYRIKLFERMNRRLYTTQAGEKLADYADSIIYQLDEARDSLQDISTSTCVRIGSNISYGSIYLPEIMENFEKSYPEIPIYMMIQNSSVIEEYLLRNELDFGIIDMAVNSSYLITEPLIHDTMTAVCAPSLPFKSLRSLRELAGAPLLVRESGSGSRNFVERIFAQHSLQPRIKMESADMYTLIESCKRGLGILFLPRLVLMPHIESGALRQIEIDGIEAARQYYLVYHRSKYLTKSMKYFQKFIKQ